MKIKKILSLFFATTLILSGCGNTDDSKQEIPNTLANETDFTQSDEDMFTDRDLDSSYDKSESVRIQLNGTTASCDSDSVQISDSTVTITDEGTYILSGTLDDGMIIVDAEDSDKPQLVFDNVSINSSNCAPLYILEADKVFVTLAENSTNLLSNAGTFTARDDNNIDGVVFSKADLTFNGAGELTISSPAGNGIVGKDDLVFTGGSYTITSSSHGLDANDSLRVKDTTITIASGKDGAHIENNDDSELGFIYISSGTFDITAEGDGLSSGAYTHIVDGSFHILAGGGYENGTQSSSDNWGNFGGGMGGQMPGGNMPGGGMGAPGGGHGGRSNGTSGTSDTTESTDDGSTSMKGIKATNSLQISGGTFSIDSADDAIHSDLSVYVKNGTFSIASGDDAIHAEESLEISDGTIDISTSYEGLEALHIVIHDGAISMQTTDDGINAAGGNDASGTGGRDTTYGNPGGMSANSNGSITILGGSVFMYAQGDGLDANGSISITGGTTIVTGPTVGDTAILDYDLTATIDGGTFIGAGSTMMAQTFSDGNQGTLAVQGSADGGTLIRIEDANGNEIISYTPETAFQCVIISTPDMEIGKSYTIYIGDSSGTFEAN